MVTLLMTNSHASGNPIIRILKLTFFFTYPKIELIAKNGFPFSREWVKKIFVIFNVTNLFQILNINV